MPGRLVAPAHLLEAIFAHTNKLSSNDRRFILRFLAGEDSTPPSQLSSLNQPAIALSASTTLNNNISSHPVQRSLLEVETTQPQQPAQLSTPTNVETPIRQVLLHEERKIEFKPQQSTRTSSNNNNNNADDDENIPFSYLSNGNDVPDGMKQYTIVDQIIFEMDYSTGCWRKLRRRVRIADKKLDHANTHFDPNNGLSDTRLTRNSATAISSRASASTSTTTTTQSLATTSRNRTSQDDVGRNRIRSTILGNPIFNRQAIRRFEDELQLQPSSNSQMIIPNSVQSGLSSGR